MGLGGFEHSNNLIVGHPRLHMEHLPTATKGKIKQLLTTGTITKPNYSASKVGKKANFHHTYGAIVIEIDGNDTFIRQLSMSKNGTICDLDLKIQQKAVDKANVEAIVYGDIHELFLADVVKDKGFFGKDSLLNTLKPKQVVLHDLIDTMAGSHHHENKPFMQYRIAQGGTTVVDEINSAIKFIGNILDKGTQPVIVASNHNSHLTQWLERVSWKDYPNQAKEILEMTLMMLTAIDNECNIDGKTPDIFKIIVDNVFNEKVVTLDYDEPLEICSFRVDSHGDKGLNGARSLAGIHSKLTAKHIIGHTHTANRIDGVLTVGTSSNLTRNFTYGLSTWSHTHAIIHDNNKAQLVLQDSTTGKYKLEKEPNSIGMIIKKKDKINSRPYLTDESYANEGYKYKLIDGEGNVVGYFKGYRGMQEITDSEWKARKLMEDGEGYGYTLEYLEEQEEG